MAVSETMRVALYARVSTDNHGQDPDNQLFILRDLAVNRGYEVVGEYIDFASGKDPNRPQWKTVMALANDRRIDGIFALRLDRVMRSVQHLCATINQLEAAHVKLIFSDMTFDPKDPNSMLTVNILSGIAQWERQINSARTKEGLEARKRKGVQLGKKRRDDIPVMQIARMRAEGISWYAISKTLDIPRTTINDRRKEIEDIIAELTDNVPRSDMVTDKGGSE